MPQVAERELPSSITGQCVPTKLVGMHRLQWMHSEGVAASAAIRLTRSGSRSSARPIATNSKPSVIARSIEARSVMPPSRIIGSDTSARTLRASSSRKASWYGYSRMKPLPAKRITVFIGCGITATNSSTGAPPLNRYIGLSSELPAVISSASTVPSCSIHCAVWIASSTVMPPRTPSVRFSLVRMAIRSPTASRTARRIPRANFARLSSDPPYSSLRWLIFGLRNALAR